MRLKWEVAMVDFEKESGVAERVSIDGYRLDGGLVVNRRHVRSRAVFVRRRW